MKRQKRRHRNCFDVFAVNFEKKSQSQANFINFNFEHIGILKVIIVQLVQAPSIFSILTDPF